MKKLGMAAFAQFLWRNETRRCGLHLGFSHWYTVWVFGLHPANTTLLFSSIKPIWFTQHTTSAKRFPGPQILWCFGTVFIILDYSRSLDFCLASLLWWLNVVRFLCMLPCVLNIIPLGFIPLLHCVYFWDLWFLHLLDFVAPGCFSQP